MMSELPTVHQAHRILIQEQKHKELSTLNTPQIESMGFGTEKRNFDNRGIVKSQQLDGTGVGRAQQNDGNGFVMRNAQSGSRPQKRGASYYCDHCKVPGHSKKRCFKIHGYPPGWKFNSPKRAAIAQNSKGDEKEASTGVNLTADLYSQLMTLCSRRIMMRRATVFLEQHSLQVNCACLQP